MALSSAAFILSKKGPEYNFFSSKKYPQKIIICVLAVLAFCAIIRLICRDTTNLLMAKEQKIAASVVLFTGFFLSVVDVIVAAILLLRQWKQKLGLEFVQSALPRIKGMSEETQEPAITLLGQATAEILA